MEHLVVLFAAAIPVGHRVEVTWYAPARNGLFSGAQRENRPAEPVIADLDTGVEYLSDFPIPSAGTKAPRSPVELQPEKRLSEPARVLRGVVRVCRVVTVRRFSEIDLQTHLSVEPE